jgi:hypothetical protein
MKEEWCMEDFPARTPPAQEKGEVWQGKSLDFGRRCSESSKQYDQLSLLLKIPKASCIGEVQKFSGTLPKGGTMQSGKLYRRDSPLERPTGGNGFSSLPTPTTYPDGKKADPEAGEKGHNKAGLCKLEDTLKKLPISPGLEDFGKESNPSPLCTAIPKGEKMSAAVPEAMMGFPLGYAVSPLMSGVQNGSLHNIPGGPRLAKTRKKRTLSGSTIKQSHSTDFPVVPTKSCQLLSGSSIWLNVPEYRGGILMSPPMVRAIQSGLKVQTRRESNRFVEGGVYALRERMRCAAFEGDRIKVRYESDGVESDWIQYPTRLKAIPEVGKCLYMGGFKEAWRLFIRITSIRTERLGDISIEDAIAEGIPKNSPDPIQDFISLWENIHGKGSWDKAKDAEVSVLDFQVLK